MSEVHEITDGIFRISNFGPQAPVEFTQFLIVDERPLLFHTGPKALFPETLEAVKKVIDPSGHPTTSVGPTWRPMSAEPSTNSSRCHLRRNRSTER